MTITMRIRHRVLVLLNYLVLFARRHSLSCEQALKQKSIQILETQMKARKALGFKELEPHSVPMTEQELQEHGRLWDR